MPFDSRVSSEPESEIGRQTCDDFATFVVVATLIASLVTMATGTDQLTPSHQSSPHAQPLMAPPPSAAGTELHYAIREELPVGSPVADLVADAKLHVHGVDAVRSFRFRLINQQQQQSATAVLSGSGVGSGSASSSGGGAFVVGESNGVIRIGSRLDREVVCSASSTTALSSASSAPVIPSLEQIGGSVTSRCVVRLDVAVQPMIYFQIIKVFVEILDINDNSPEFRPDSRTVELSESMSPGAFILLPPAVDPDVGLNGIQRYELTPDGDFDEHDDRPPTGSSSSSSGRHRLGSDRSRVGGGGGSRSRDVGILPFNLTTSRKSDGSTELRLVVAGQLDRETKDRYRARVTAYDGGVPVPRSGTVDLTVVLLDANDNGPMFERDTYVATLIENSPPGSRVTQVRASDADIGDNGRVVYQLQHDGGGGDRKRQRESIVSADTATFSIDDRTGVVSVSGSVDYESNPTGYRLLVTARDCGLPEMLSSDAVVVVRLVDVNDNAPTIRVNTIRVSDADRAAISEDAAPETFVAHVIAADADSGDNGRVECRLVGVHGAGITAAADPLLHFRLRPTHDAEYHLVTSGLALDREQQAGYDIELVCSDNGMPPLTSVRRLTIDVLDVNDNAPRFDRPLYHAEIVENNYVGTFVVQLNATDPDLGPNGLVRYEQIDEDHEDLAVSKMFHIDPTSGIVTANVRLDRERTSRYRIRVRAIDSGDPPRTGTAALIVSVVDIDDELPVFSMPSYRFEIAENQPPGSSVGRLSAVDADSPPFGRFYFNLRPTLSGSRASMDPSGLAFSIDRRTGVIVTTRTLDRETQESYELVAEAISESASGEHTVDRFVVVSGYSSTAAVSVKILDVNDNRPIFEIPDGEAFDGGSGSDGAIAGSMKVFVSNRSTRGQVITSLSATDADLGQNASVEYSIADSRDSDMFSIDSELGVVRLNVDMASERDGEVRSVVVMATDQGVPERMSSAVRLLVVVNYTAVSPLSASLDRSTGVDQHHTSAGSGQQQPGRRQVVATSAGSASSSAAASGGHFVSVTGSSGPTRRDRGRSSSTGGSSSLTVSVVLVGAACGSGFVLVTTFVAVATFVLRRRRRRLQLQPAVQGGRDNRRQYTAMEALYAPYCCCCCEHGARRHGMVEAKTTSTTPITPAAVYTVDAGSPIKQLTSSGRKTTLPSTGSVAMTTVTAPGDDDVIWVGGGCAGPLPAGVQHPDVLQSASPTESKMTSGTVDTTIVTRTSINSDRNWACQRPRLQRVVALGESEVQHQATSTNTPATASQAANSIDDNDDPEDGPTWQSNRECLRRTERSAPGEVLRLLQHQKRDTTTTATLNASPMASSLASSSASDTPTRRQSTTATTPRSKANGGMVTLQCTPTVVATCGNGTLPRAPGKLHGKTIPPPPPPPMLSSASASVTTSSSSYQLRGPGLSQGEPPPSSYCRYNSVANNSTSVLHGTISAATRKSSLNTGRKSSGPDRSRSPAVGTAMTGTSVSESSCSMCKSHSSVV